MEEISAAMSSKEDSFNALQKQLVLARTEINNLRKEIRSLRYLQSKEMNNIKTSLENWRCPTCRMSSSQEDSIVLTESQKLLGRPQGSIELQPVGYISTGFMRKRAVPRQPNMNLSSHGKVTLYNYVFTNPEHSLQGLDGFSHMWILFHFHKNQSNHIRAKVAPPRLNGTRIGVFGTRSPHRPCPVGLSLVQIDKIEGCSIYFSGVDMLDGTPVLDLKPYIPHYDNPIELSMDYPDCSSMERLELDGQESDPETVSSSTSMALSQCDSPEATVTRAAEREAPDGEEGELEGVGSHSSLFLRTYSPINVQRHVRVPDWISHPPVTQLQVTFTPQAENLLSSLQDEENVMRIITDILRDDPRSVYLRDRYANQFFTFLINNYHVSCKFDDNNHTVKVFRIVPAGTLCECGHPEWQCSTHGGSTET